MEKRTTRIIFIILLFISDNSWSFFNVNLVNRRVSLEVAIELSDGGLDADTTSYVFENTRTTLDTGDYDGGVTYSFELVVASVDSVARNVDLLNAANTVVATISVPANTATLTRRRVVFTPTAGASNYRLRTPAVTAISDVYLRSARILVTQVNATKTKIYYPLVSDLNANGQAVETAVDSSTGPFWFSTDVNSIHWLKDSNNLATVDSGNAWTLEAVIGATAATGTAKVALLQEGSTTALVAGSTASTTATAPTLVSASFPDNAANFTNNTSFQAKMYHTHATTDSQIYKAGIWVKLVNLSKGSVVYRVGRGDLVSTSTVAKYIPEGRELIIKAAFTRPIFYYEVTSTCSVVSCATASLYDNGTNDSGVTTPTLVTSSTNTPGTVSGRTRSAAISLTSGDRFFAGYTRASGTFTLTANVIVVTFSR